MVLLGSVSSTVCEHDDVGVCSGHNKPAKRQRTTIWYMHKGYSVCRKRFTFLHGSASKKSRPSQNIFLKMEYLRAWNTGKQPKQSLSFKRILGIFFSLYKTILSSMLLFCQVVYPVLSITMWRYYYLLITRRYYYNCRTCMHIREQTYTHTHMHIIEQCCLTDFLLVSFTETQYFKSTKKTLYSTIWDSFCSWHTFCFIRFLQQI